MSTTETTTRRTFITLLAAATVVVMLPLAVMAFTFTVKTPHTKQSTVFTRSVGVSGTFTLVTGEREVRVDIFAYDRVGNLLRTATGTISTLRSGSWWASVATTTALAKYQIRFTVKMTNGTTRTYYSPVYTF